MFSAAFAQKAAQRVFRVSIEETELLISSVLTNLKK
jgi:hypothetical protein